MVEMASASLGSRTQAGMRCQPLLRRLPRMKIWDPLTDQDSPPARSRARSADASIIQLKHADFGRTHGLMVPTAAISAEPTVT